MIAELPPAVRAALADHLARVRHDLGKYVALQVRSVGEGATDEVLRQALASDLLATRSGPAGVADAIAVWDALAPPLRGEAPLAGGQVVDLRGDVDFDALVDAMDRVGAAVAALRRGEGPARWMVAAALAASDRCRALAIRARGRS